MLKQRTLKKSIRAAGVGLHTGQKIYLTLRPAPPDTGVVFRRIDLDEAVDIPANSGHVVDTRLSTTIGAGGARVATVEHLMSAAAGLGIDNLYVDVSAPEVPIMDGSSGPFVFLFQSAGVEEQAAPKKFIRIKRKIEVREKGKWVRLRPYNGYKIRVEIEFQHPVFKAGPQKAELDFSAHSYVNDISRARTFGFLRDYEALRAQQLVLGGSMDNAVVLDDYRVLNRDGLRYQDEFVRHKLLDVVGDLHLLGHMLIGCYEGSKSGHGLNKRLRDRLLEREDAWEVITWRDDEKIRWPVAWGGDRGLEPAGEPA